MIVEQLLDHDRKREAVEQLRLAWRDLTDDGRDADAQEVRSRIIEMAPDRDPEIDPPEASTSPMVDAEGVIDLPEILPYDEPEERPVAAKARAEADIAATGAGIEELADLDVGLVDDETAESGLETEDLEIDPTSLAGDDEVEGELDATGVEILPTAMEDEEDAGYEIEDADVEPTSLAEPPEEEEYETEAGVLPTSLVEEGEAEEGGREVELETVEVEHVPAEFVDAVDAAGDLGAERAPEQVAAPPAAEDRVADIEVRLRAEGREPELLIELADALLESGDRERATSSLGEALELYQRRGQHGDAARVLDELLRLNVNDVRAYQKRIELALRAGDRRALIDAYLSLADCLDRTDAGDKARVVYQRVLELDPDNERARSALDLIGDAPVTPPPPERKPAPAPTAAQSSNSFVDLGSLILEEKAQSKSTRFTVPSEDPQHESDVNFSDMLSQFKSMVEDAIEKEDTASHYDLGLAYKEMGLIDEAIAELQIAARGMDYRLRAIEMLGACFVEKKDFRIALKVLKRALQVPKHTDEDLVGIFYAMGRAHEALNETANALEWYERVMGCDVHFKDVAKRIAALRQ